MSCSQSCCDTGPELYHLPGLYEPFSAISHLFGAVLFLFLGYRLIQHGRGNRDRMVFLSIYAASCVLQLSLSGLYHMLVRGTAEHRVVERLDHGAIFILIAGSFTPAHGILFTGRLRRVPLLLIWSSAIMGLTLKTIFFDQVAEGVGLTFYFVLGWFGAVTGAVLTARYGLNFTKPLFLGGLAYSAGGIAQFVPCMPFVPGIIHSHEMFHVTVLLGAFLHWQFVWQFAAGVPAAQLLAEPDSEVDSHFSSPMLPGT